jgi:hypothetical protein
MGARASRQMMWCVPPANGGRGLNLVLLYAICCICPLEGCEFFRIPLGMDALKGAPSWVSCPNLVNVNVALDGKMSSVTQALGQSRNHMDFLSRQTS